MKKLLLIILLILMPLSAYAEWQKYGTNRDGDKYYFDISTIKKNGKFIKLWTMEDYKNPTKSGAFSARVYAEYDCKEETEKLLNLTNFSSNLLEGNIIGDFAYNNQPVPIAPGTVHSSLLKIICK